MSDPRSLSPRLTIPQAAELLAVSSDTIRRMIARGELRAYRYGPRINRIDPEDLLKVREPVTSLADLRGGAAA